MTCMMFQLNYLEGAVSGKSLKRRTILSEDEQNQRKKKYEENRPDKKFNKNWKEGRQWFQYDEFMNVMTCKICIDHYISVVEFKNTKHIYYRVFKLSVVSRS